MSITRTAMIDDDGTGTTGTIFNNPWKVELYDQIDASDRMPHQPAITPTILAASANDWNPTSLSTARTIRVTSSAAVNITGIVAQTVGTSIILWNRNIGDSITLKHQSASSVAANRFIGPGFADFILTAGKGCEIYYDTGGFWAIR